MQNRLIPEPCVTDKNWEGCLGRYPLRIEGSRPHTRLPSPGLQCQEEKSGCKNQQGMLLSEEPLESQSVPP